MDAQATAGLLRHFREINEFRAGNASHPLSSIISIAIMAVLCGAQGWVDVETWAQARLQWLKTVLDLPHDIPSHDTFDRVFRRLDPLKFEACFQKWSDALRVGSGGQFLAVDGKTLRRSWKRAWSKTPVHLVSAFLTKNQLLLGQLATESKSNEITAIPKLLAMLDLVDCTVTIDAMGCQREIAAMITGNKGHFILALKDNQPTLHTKAKRLMDEGILENFGGMAHGMVDATEEGHGRKERRRVWVCTEVKWLGEELLKNWPQIASLIVVERWRQNYGDMDGKSSYERHYYISDHAHTDAAFFAEGIRSHWGVESMHWSLDVSMNEDQCRLRAENGAENFSRLRRIALNRLKQWQPRKPNGKPMKVGVRLKQRMCDWNPQYLLEVLRSYAIALPAGTGQSHMT